MNAFVQNEKAHYILFLSIPSQCIQSILTFRRLNSTLKNSRRLMAELNWEDLSLVLECLKIILGRLRASYFELLGKKICLKARRHLFMPLANKSLLTTSVCGLIFNLSSGNFKNTHWTWKSIIWVRVYLKCPEPFKMMAHNIFFFLKNFWNLIEDAS